jgi:thioredoxin-related protein
MLRRFALSILMTAVLPAKTYAKDSYLPPANDLRALAKTQSDKREPLVILVSLPNCPYCELVRRSYLLPYRTEGLLQSWQVDTTDSSTLIDFEGKTTSKAAWTKTQRIKVTPTLLFLSRSGAELAPRIEGITVPDFYGAYLDERLATARRKLSA